MRVSLQPIILTGCLLLGEAYEWAGIFSLPKAQYLWTAQKDHDVYVQDTMKIVALPATAASQEELKRLEQSGNNTLRSQTCVQKNNHEVFKVAEGVCYQLVFDTTVWQSLYRLDASDSQHVALFTEHMPTEFETDAHYLKDDHGHDIEPAFELPELIEQAFFWESMAAALVVNLITLCGVVLSTPCMGGTKERAAWFEAVLSTFAAGALLACAFYLLLFEATHLVGTGFESEVATLLNWGTAILGGFFLPTVIESAGVAYFTANQTQSGSEAQSGNGMSVEMGEGLQPAEVVDDAVKSANTARVVSAVLIGDFFHNLCDGFFLAAAFKGCGGSFAWGVVLGTCLHELPQELADYAILTSSDVGWSRMKALAWNFGTGLSVLVGALIVQLASVSDSTIGLLLCFGGGTYVYLAAVVCMPKFASLNGTIGQNLTGVLAFLLGAGLIFLIALDHKHCEAHGHSHDH